MGGHADGHVASETLCRALERIGALATLAELAEAVEDAIAAANRHLLALGGAGEPPAVIGTTVAALLIHGGYAMCLWCGDSRVHLLRDREAFLLTRDHTLVRELQDRGDLDPGAAQVHVEAHVVSRAVGVAAAAEVDRLALELCAGDRFLLCTDGVSRHVATAEMADLGDEDPARMVRNVVDLARARGAADDVTAVAVNLAARAPPR